MGQLLTLNSAGARSVDWEHRQGVCDHLGLWRDEARRHVLRLPDCGGSQEERGVHFGRCQGEEGGAGLLQQHGHIWWSGASHRQDKFFWLLHIHGLKLSQVLVEVGQRGRSISAQRLLLSAMMERASRVPMSLSPLGRIFFSGAISIEWVWVVRVLTCGTTWRTRSTRRSWCSTTRSSTASTTWAQWPASSLPSPVSPASRKHRVTIPLRGWAVGCRVTCQRLLLPGCKLRPCRCIRFVISPIIHKFESYTLTCRPSLDAAPVSFRMSVAVKLEAPGPRNLRSQRRKVLATSRRTTWQSWTLDITHHLYSLFIPQKPPIL